MLDADLHLASGPKCASELKPSEWDEALSVFRANLARNIPESGAAALLQVRERLNAGLSLEAPHLFVLSDLLSCNIFVLEQSTVRSAADEPDVGAAVILARANYHPSDPAIALFCRTEVSMFNWAQVAPEEEKKGEQLDQSGHHEGVRGENDDTQWPGDSEVPKVRCAGFATDFHMFAAPRVF